MSTPDKDPRVLPYFKWLATKQGDARVLVSPSIEGSLAFEYFGLPEALLEISALRPDWIAPRPWHGRGVSKQRFDEHKNPVRIRRGRGRWRVVRWASTDESGAALPGFEPWMLRAAATHVPRHMQALTPRQRGHLRLVVDNDRHGGAA